MSGMLAVLNASDEDFRGLTENLYDASGAAQDMADTQLNNLSGQLTILKSELEAVAISFGELILPIIKSLVQKLQNVLHWLNGLSVGQKKVILGLMTFAAVIGPILLLIGKFLILGKALSVLLPTIGMGFNSIIGPILLVVAALAALIAAVAWLKGTKPPEMPNNPSSFQGSYPANGGPSIHNGGYYAAGLDYVPRDMGVHVHEGERILTKQENEDYSRQKYNGPETLHFELPVILDGQTVAHNQYEFNVREQTLRGNDLLEG